MKILFASVNSQYIHTNIAVRNLNNSVIQSGIGIDSEYLEFNINLDMTVPLNMLTDAAPDIIGFSCYIWNIEYILKLCADIKIIMPSIKIVLGGPEVSFRAKDILSEHNYIDYVICGEGEEVIIDFLKYLTVKKDLPLCLYCRNSDGTDILGHGYAVIGDLNGIPFPYSDYELENPNGRIFYYEASRGCPYSCSYCLSGNIKGIREVPMDIVITHLNKFMEAGVPLVKFVDRTFNCNSKRAKHILKYIAGANCKTCFHFEIGADLLDNEIISIVNGMPKGRIQFEAGVQSANEMTLKEVCRRTNIKALINNVSNIINAGNIHIHLDLIAGLPHEDINSFQNSYDTVMSVRPHNLQIGFLKLLYGTAIRDNAEKMGLKYRKYPPYEILSTPDMPGNDLLKLKEMEQIHNIYYNSGKFVFSYEFLLDKYKSPFKLLKKLTEFAKQQDKLNTAMSYESKYGMLYRFAQSILNNEENELFRELLRADFMSSGAKGKIPDYLKGFASQQLINEMVRQLKEHGIASSLQARRGSYDFFSVIPGTKERANVFVVFDHGEKDVLTRRPCMKIFYNYNMYKVN